MMKKQFLLETNPSFILIKIDEDNFVFYNSIHHIGCKLKLIEVKILDLMYTYRDKNFILSKFSDKHRELVSKALDFIGEKELLSIKAISDKNERRVFPSNYFLHLTYHCNLKCSYCYNRDIRKNHPTELKLESWKSIVDKISSYAKEITLTGGEFMLYKDCINLIKYIRLHIPDVYLICISNGMHDYIKENLTELFKYIDEISLSCDSIEKEGLRKGFKPNLFVTNVEWIRNHFPKLKITISSVLTKFNDHDIETTSQFCINNRCSFDKNILIPEEAKDIDDMPSIIQQDEASCDNTEKFELKRLNAARFRCGAGKSICSIDPMGNVYPCQSLHYKEFFMGNILECNIGDLKYINSSQECIPSVNKIPVCSSCKVRYICGGGCLATGFRINNRTLDRNHLTCHLNYVNALEKLRHLNNRL